MVNYYVLHGTSILVRHRNWAEDQETTSFMYSLLRTAPGLGQGSPASTYLIVTLQLSSVQFS
jgi:hypothetical protein